MITDEIEKEQARVQFGSRIGRRVLVACGSVPVLILALWLWHRSHADQNSAEAILRRADDLSWKNDWVEADPLYARAEAKFRAENNPSRALYANVSRLVLLAESEELPGILVILGRDLELPAAQNPETRLRILTIQGMIETNYDASLARQTWAQVRSLALLGGQFLLAARASGEEGMADFQLGDIGAAKKLVVTAWLAAKYLGDPAARVRYESVYGAGLVELHRYDQALKTLNDAIRTAETTKGIAYPSIAISYKIDALRGLGHDQEALNLADAAIRRLPSDRLDAHLFQLLTSKGDIYEDLDRWDQAVKQYMLALDYAQRLTYWRGITQTGGLLARAYEHENQLPTALNAINQAINANTHLPEELYFTPRNLAIKAAILARMGRTGDAEALYQKSVSLIGTLLTAAETPTIERSLITDLGQVYVGQFELYAQEGKPGQALASVERARGRVEAQALEHHTVVEPHAPTAQEQNITRLNLQLIRTDDPLIRERLLNLLSDAELQSDDTSLAGRTAVKPVILKALQTDLLPSELLTEYVLASPRSYILAITRTTARIYSTADARVIKQQATEYRDTLVAQKTDPDAAGALFDELLEPLPDYGMKSSVIIVPDGALHLLPFGALMDRGKYAIETHHFSVVPSATVLDILRRRPDRLGDTPRHFLGVAASPENPEYAPMPIEGVDAFLPAPPLRPLPGAYIEVRSIAALLRKPETVVVGEDATETAFRSLPLAQYRVVHLALHGYVNLDSPDESALVFTPGPQGTDDGLLQVRQIRNLPLRARLVTLSACDAGVGPVGAVGVDDIVNAFIEAGARSVISTLWDMKDQATAHFMELFYQKLARHGDLEDSLRETQLQVLRSGYPPFYWAGMEIAGEPHGHIF